MPEKREDIQLELQEYLRQLEDREAKRRILRRVAENKELDLVQWSTPSKTGKIIAQRRGVGNLKTPAPTTTEIINTTLSGAARDERT
jgi:hypothetical protein